VRARTASALTSPRHHFPARELADNPTASGERLPERTTTDPETP
jgi:hypothetical protein